MDDPVSSLSGFGKRFMQENMDSRFRRNVTLVVLGDLGRSPRMQYHALALAEELAEVALIGYAGSDLHETLQRHPHIRCHRLRAPWLGGRQHLPRVLFLGYSLLRIVNQQCRLLWTLLFSVPKPDVVLVQNPPAIPTLLTALLVAKIRSARLVIDWHNFGYTLLALRLGEDHPALRLARWYERSLGVRADAHICVSAGMRRELIENWGLTDVSVLYDQPAEQFAPTPLYQRHHLFRRLQKRFPNLCWDARPSMPSSGYREHTFATTLSVPSDCCHAEILAYCRDVDRLPPAALAPFVDWRPERPGIIVSASSWTSDEDFAVLIEALKITEQKLRRRSADRSLPRLLLFITGQGTLRTYYEDRFRELDLQAIAIYTLWLAAEDYPLLLGAADLGLCLHRSSSGLDLPMKVADMLGSGIAGLCPELWALSAGAIAARGKRTVVRRWPGACGPALRFIQGIS